MARAKRSRPDRDITPTHPNAAAIDIGARMHVAAVAPDRDAEPVRSFGTFTGDLHRLADWLERCGVRTVAMESTGVYWIPVFEVLDQRGFDVVLVNARDAKHVPGRKTDVSDAQWLRQLHEYGLLRASFQPKGEVATLRAYLRQRERLLDYAASHIQHMQKALMQMNVQLHHIVSDITGATGMRIVRDIVAGERDPAVLAAHGDRRCHASAEEISAALAGNWREEHVFALGQALDLYDVYQAKLADCDARIEQVLGRLQAASERPAGRLPPARHRDNTANAPAFNARALLHSVLGIDLADSSGRSNTWTKGLRWALGSGARIGPGEVFCVRRVDQGWRGVRIGGGSGRRLRRAWRARTPRAARVYRRREGHGGFGRRGGCHQRRLRPRRSRSPGDTCRSRSGRRLRYVARRARGYGRWPADWGGRPRRSRGSCAATRRHVAVAWTTGQQPRSGTLNGPPAARSQRNWRPTRPCRHMCRTGWPGWSLPRVGLPFAGRSCPGRAAGKGVGRTGSGPRRGARSRSPSGCGSTFPAMKQCASATRPSTRHCTCRAGARCGAR